MSVPEYSYVTYIRATAEQVWRALTDADVTARFWGHAQVSDWNVGSRVEHVRVDGSGVVDAAGVVLAVEAPTRLSFTFGEPREVDDPTIQQSVVTFDIDEFRDIVRASVTHSGFATTADRDAISEGWPTVFANLKTLLETGEVLPTPPWEFHAVRRAAQMARHDPN
ncbi:hypothetical protein GCM10022286_13240 [Gryllotalpicola daejeonensis]|uniref:Activator of Hsp90 ATPase homologue 1/2-like C-terminal domain-containing protein n=1 Tax=Gryllotalpicola daejeonensis TaxID=993087 RepID=A0ABP7ZIE6_9MICO